MVKWKIKDVSALVVKIAENKQTYKEIADEVYRQTGLQITQPTVASYLKGFGYLKSA